MTRKLAPVLLAVLTANCGSTSRRPPLEIFSDMKRQAKYEPQAASRLFSDGRASRAPVEGTVARGSLKAEEAAGVNPLPIDLAVLERGQERFNIYCAPCHDRTGSGRGIVALRSSWLAGDLRDQRIRDLTDGQIFDTITHGKRSMPGYRFQIGERDRWAIVEYVRALQRASDGALADVPPELRNDLR
jgi:mono/diheme cytochrome c family protein